MTRSVELKLERYYKNKEGLIVSFLVHRDDQSKMNDIEIGDVFQAELLKLEDHGGVSPPLKDKTEGEKLRIRAVMLCKDPRFQLWATRDKDGTEFLEPTEDNARAVMLEMCNIDSRSELALSIPAQESFKHMLGRYLRETGQAAERRGG